MESRVFHSNTLCIRSTSERFVGSNPTPANFHHSTSPLEKCPRGKALGSEVVKAPLRGLTNIS